MLIRCLKLSLWFWAQASIFCLSVILTFKRLKVILSLHEIKYLVHKMYTAPFSHIGLYWRFFLLFLLLPHIFVLPLHHCAMESFVYSTESQTCSHSCKWKDSANGSVPEKNAIVWQSMEHWLWGITGKNMTIWNGLSCCPLIRCPWTRERVCFFICHNGAF